MENMEIDLVTVPDTPDRFSTEIACRGGNFGEEVQSSSGTGGSGISNFLDKGVRSRVKDHGRFNIENGKSRRLFSRPRGDHGIRAGTPQNSHPVINVVDSPSSSKNASFIKRMMSEKVSSRPKFSEYVASSNDRTKLDGDTSSIAELLAVDKKMQNEKINDLISCPNIRRKKTLLQGNMNSVIDDVKYSSATMGLDRGKGIHISRDNKQKPEHILSRPLHSATLSRKNGPRRLVLNGCISPQNVAKAKGSAKFEKICGDVKKNDSEDRVSISGISPIHIHSVSPVPGGIDLDRGKGKGVMEESSAQRSLVNLTEEANTNKNARRDAVETIGGTGGWRSTRNHSSATSVKCSDAVRHHSRTNGGDDHSHRSSDPVSLLQEPICSAQSSSGSRSEMDGECGRHYGNTNIVKRQRKHGSTFSNSGECSTSADDSEISFLWSSEGPTNARSTRNQSDRHHGNLLPIIEVDDTSPAVQPGSSQNTNQMDDGDSDAKARQLEADEMLAHELQEQLYHELPGVGAGEVDANIAWTLQHEEEVRRSSSLRRQHVHPRDTSMSHPYRQFHTQVPQSSSILPTNRASRARARARAPASARVARLRDRSPAIPSRERSIRFHPNINVEMRIHILEALEAAAGTAEESLPASFFHLQRDFNENDYEMLLALDENNHQHVGTNNVQINRLPESIVQAETSTEACAVCLETPTIGDTIRHLPCLHKYHKDCIDPWLRRKSSCPICKSGIT